MSQLYLALLEIPWLVLPGTLWLPVVSLHLAPDPLDCTEVTWSYQNHRSARLDILHFHCWAVFGRQGLWTCQKSLFSRGKGEYHHRHQMWGSC